MCLSLGPLGYFVAVTLRRFVRGRGRGPVLDLGGGEGLMGSVVAGTEDVLIIDAVEDAARVARERGARAVVGDVRRLPVRDGAAAAVLSSDVLEHLSPGDVPAAVKEMSRVLYPGGLALVHTSVYGLYLRRWLRPGAGRLDADDLADGHLTRVTAGELYSLFRASGFVVEKFVFYKHLFQPVYRVLEDILFGFAGKKRSEGPSFKRSLSRRAGSLMEIVATLRAVPVFLDAFLFGRLPAGAGIFKLRKP